MALYMHSEDRRGSSAALSLNGQSFTEEPQEQKNCLYPADTAASHDKYHRAALSLDLASYAGKLSQGVRSLQELAGEIFEAFRKRP